ncbi:MAG: translocation/assembly module TamB, partial [Muribaculum sp.]|nr:translocation/assembly module TamB [Muribaculum sp.]
NGMLNGEMKITGDFAKPVFNGFIDFDTTSVKVTMLGTAFEFSDEKIPVDSGIVTFNNFSITGCNDNPLYVNGTLNARNIANLGLDLKMNARNIEIVNSTRPRGADVYGKAFLDIDATVKGDMEALDVDADLTLLSKTNVTYVVSEATQSLNAKSSEDMVHFVQFNDTTVVADADSITTSAMALDLTASLHLERGATINVDLSANGSNKVQLMPSGDVMFTMSELNGDRMTGRIDINSGFVRYTPPLMSEKNFSFQEGSYIAFNGDMMNPLLNIHAVDVMKANVTQEGQNSRLVNFDVILSITNSLDNMNVAFDLSTDDDITVQNELASMSAEQRANQAMNMLLYNVYTGAGTKGNANLSGNQLYSFLTSKLNSWAANNIHGVDISFGIDQYDKTSGGSTTSTTSYSYRVSKTFFNDRFKIVVGGNYSTDSDADENFSQNLINDISFEYMLNRSGSIFIRIFRHTGYESILEGEITQTGVGFVLKKKLNSLWELFGIKRD